MRVNFSMGKKACGFILCAFFFRTTKCSYTCVMTAPSLPSFVQSGHTTVPQCPTTMCALGKTVANTMAHVYQDTTFSTLIEGILSLSQIYPNNLKMLHSSVLISGHISGRLIGKMKPHQESSIRSDKMYCTFINPPYREL